MNAESLTQSMRAHGVPEHIQDGLAAWVLQGRPTGGFLSAVLANDFALAALRADDVNYGALKNIASWLMSEAPDGCWGSTSAMSRWRSDHKAAADDSRGINHDPARARQKES